MSRHLRNSQPRTCLPSTAHLASGARRGMVLILVLIVIAMLGLAGFAFLDSMVTENKATRLAGRDAQARLLTESGVDYVRTLLAAEASEIEQLGGFYDNPDQFRGGLLFEMPDEELTGRFTLISPVTSSPDQPPEFRYGLQDESAKLNLNILLEWDKQQPGAARNALLQLPGMTPEVADAILDWIDPDSDPREAGAEVDYYSGLEPPYGPTNGPVRSFEELLLVRGVTRDLLLGRDTNRNGVLEPAEINTPRPDPAPPAGAGLAGSGFSGSFTGDAATSSTAETNGGIVSSQTMDPTMAGTDLLPGGWSTYLTLYSAESPLAPNGQPRINLNDADLAALHAQLLERFNQPLADFIIGYRQFGAAGTSSSGSGQSARQPTDVIDLTFPASFTFASPLDPFGVTVAVDYGRPTDPITLTSPLGGGAATEGAEALDQWLQLVSTTGDAPELGRVNINLAPEQVLRAIPGITDSQVEGILANRPSLDSISLTNPPSVLWILSNQVVTLEELKSLYPYICGGGGVFRGQFIGHTDQLPAVARAEVLLDVTQRPVRIAGWRDLRRLGRGYPVSLLTNESGGSTASGSLPR